MKRGFYTVIRPRPVIGAEALRLVTIKGHPRHEEGQFPPGHKYPARSARRTPRNAGGPHGGLRLHSEPCSQRVLR